MCKHLRIGLALMREGIPNIPGFEKKRPSSQVIEKV